MGDNAQDRKTYTVSIKNMFEAREFCHIVSQRHYDVDLRQARYVVDAKSILGILSLNLSKPIQMDVYGSDDGNLIGAIDKFLVK